MLEILCSQDAAQPSQTSYQGLLQPQASQVYCQVDYCEKIKPENSNLVMFIQGRLQHLLHLMELTPMFSTNKSTPRVAESQELYLSHFLRSRLWYSWLGINLQQVGPNLEDAGLRVCAKPAFKATKKKEDKANMPRKMILHVLIGTFVMWQVSASLKWKTQPRNVRGLTSAHIVNHFWLYQNQTQGAFLSQEGDRHLRRYQSAHQLEGFGCLIDIFNVLLAQCKYIHEQIFTRSCANIPE